MEVYRKAIEQMLKHEGGYTNNINDNGGETYRGISRKYFSRWEGWSIIDSTDHFDDRLDEMVINFYKEFFWDALKLEMVEDEQTAIILLDFSVNIGKKAITKKIQRITGVTPDGTIGPVTIQAINSMDSRTFIYQILLEVTDLYVTIVNRNKSQKVFLLGWLNRVMDSYYTYERSRVAA